MHALCGENGAGKSTLIKILGGLHPHGTYSGEFLLDGSPAHFANVRAAERAGIALIAQELALVPRMSIAENLMLGREPVARGLIRWDRLRAAARAALDRVGSDLDLDTPVMALGLGRQQVVEIAKALDKRSRILILDEPTAALPESDARRLLRLVAELRASGVSSIYVSHRLDEVFSIADRITVLRDGRTVATDAARDWTPERVIAAMVGRELSTPARTAFGFVHPAGYSASDRSAISLRDWSVAHPEDPSHLVLDGVSLAVDEGEVLGVAGLMGAGRTALLTSLFGLARARVGGRLLLPGRASDRPFRHPAEAIDCGMALVSEDRKRSGLVPESSVLENLTLPTLGRFRRRGLLDDVARARAADEQIRALSIRAPSRHAHVARLSGGTQQKVVLGKWLLSKPRVLLLDEPTRGIDVGTKTEIHRLVRSLAGKGVGILLVSSDLPELLALSHRVLVLRQGRRAAEFPIASATPEAVMSAATGAA